MNINAERFFALTAMLAAPLVAAPACVITDNDDDTDTAGATDSASATMTSTTVSTTDPGDSSTDPTDATSVSTTMGDSSGGSSDGTGSDTSGTDGTTGGPDLGNCCEPHGGLGCEVPEVQECVCAVDALCCDTAWDAICAQEVNDLGCGDCMFPPQPFDCYCTATCDDAPVDTPWQVCGSDATEAGVAGQAACEADLDAMCATFSCEMCQCSTAEVPEIEC